MDFHDLGHYSCFQDSSQWKISRQSSPCHNQPTTRNTAAKLLYRIMNQPREMVWRHFRRVTNSLHSYRSEHERKTSRRDCFHQLVRKQLWVHACIARWLIKRANGCSRRACIFWLLFKNSTIDSDWIKASASFQVRNFTAVHNLCNFIFNESNLS